MIRICILVNYLIGCFTCRYYSQKEGYTGMKLICARRHNVGIINFNGEIHIRAQEQQQDIIDRGKAYDEDGKAFEGQHMKSAAEYPEFQGDDYKL